MAGRCSVSSWSWARRWRRRVESATSEHPDDRVSACARRAAGLRRGRRRAVSRRCNVEPDRPRSRRVPWCVGVLHPVGLPGDDAADPEVRSTGRAGDRRVLGPPAAPPGPGLDRRDRRSGARLESVLAGDAMDRGRRGSVRVVELERHPVGRGRSAPHHRRPARPVLVARGRGTVLRDPHRGCADRVADRPSDSDPVDLRGHRLVRPRCSSSSCCRARPTAWSSAPTPVAASCSPVVGSPCCSTSGRRSPFDTRGTSSSPGRWLLRCWWAWRSRRTTTRPGCCTAGTQRSHW